MTQGPADDRSGVPGSRCISACFCGWRCVGDENIDVEVEVWTGLGDVAELVRPAQPRLQSTAVAGVTSSAVSAAPSMSTVAL
jgi:hypothetical protein